MAITVTSATPSSGTVSGGQTVTIRGAGFSGTDSVEFGGIAALSFVVVDDNTITAVTPPHSSGVVNIDVNQPD